MRESEPTGLKLHLGCNRRPIKGYVNVDIEQYDGVDIIADLEKRWPWDDGTVDEILTNDLPEHLRGWYEEPDPDKLVLAMDLADKEQFRQAFNHLIGALKQPKRTYGVIHFMEEANRVLRVGGRLKAQIPTTESRAWAQDPTHVSFWNENTMLYFTDPLYRGFYPGMIKGKWKTLWCGTSTPNMKGESWIKIVLEKE